MIGIDKLKKDKACVGKIRRNAYRILMQERDLLEHPGIEELIILKCILNEEEGRDSSVGTATRYGPGIESRWLGDFPHPSTPSLGPTQPSIQWVPGLSRG